MAALILQVLHTVSEIFFTLCCNGDLNCYHTEENFECFKTDLSDERLLNESVQISECAISNNEGLMSGSKHAI